MKLALFVLVLLGGTARQAEQLLDDGRHRLPAGQRASAGTAQWQRGESASSLTSRADHALYRAKRSSRGGAHHDLDEEQSL